MLLGETVPAFDKPNPLAEPVAGLNDSQRAAVEFALSARDVALIHGPPGTGKTPTVVELVRQAVLRGDKVLATAASNLAVDNLVERLVAAGVRTVRLGHPARVLPELRRSTRSICSWSPIPICGWPATGQRRQCAPQPAARFTRAKPKPGARQEMRAEARELLADARRLELQIVAGLLDDAQVLCGTLTGLDFELLGERRFDLVVIDEAAQAIEPACWIPLARTTRLVLAGDDCQLPPTVLSQTAARDGLGPELPERLLAGMVPTLRGG